MPSRLLPSTLNQLAASGVARQRLKAAAAQVTQGVQTMRMAGPYLGFQPDIDPNLTDGTAFTDLTNVLARAHGEEHGEVLCLPDGYRQVDFARLPLGDGATLPASPVTDGKPVVRLDQMDRTTPTGTAGTGTHTFQWIITPLAVTAGTGTAGTSNMYRINSSGQWAQVAPDTSMGATTPLSATRDGDTAAPSMPDSCVAPFGATARATVGGAGADGQSGAINEPAWIFTNNFNEVMVFPSSSADTIAGTQAYEPLTSCATLDNGVGFRAKSVETWNGRVLFLNTSEAGSRLQRRLRWTPKFSCDPDPALATAVGAGFYDFPEFQGEGLRIETLGDLLGVYFSDGIAFMRATGVATAPHEPQILATERGLLSPHGMCAMGRNTHFLITTDGWWVLDQSGRFQELGIVNLNGKVIPKWRQSFYDDIPPNQRHRLYCYYDQPNNLVYIARPTFSQPEPREVWIYDPTSDRVFLENYPITCFGTFSATLQSGTVIDNLLGTINAQTGVIDSTGPIAGFPKSRVHGDSTGFVYVHRRDITGYDSATNTPVVQNPTWSFSVGSRSPGTFRNQVTVDRVSLEYFNHQNTNTVSIQVRGPSADGSQTRTVLLTGGDTENVRSRDAWFRYTSQAPGLTVSGTGEYHIRSVAMDLWSDELETRGL